MSELNDYLEGKITFEEFERRREERKAKNKVTYFIPLVNLIGSHVHLSASISYVT